VDLALRDVGQLLAILVNNAVDEHDYNDNP
jgi:hypothetical protein